MKCLSQRVQDYILTEGLKMFLKQQSEMFRNDNLKYVVFSLKMSNPSIFTT